MLAARGWIQNDRKKHRSPIPLSKEAAVQLAQTALLDVRSVNWPLRWGTGSSQGHRAHMEDRHIAMTGLPADDKPDALRAAYFGVFDGHSGSTSAQIASCALYHCLAQESIFPADLPAALRSAYLAADEQLHQQLQTNDASGCTALSAVVLGRQLVVANAGDSRAVLSCNGQALDLTADHKPTNPAERARVLAAGGAICGNTACDTYLCGSGCRRQSSGRWASSSGSGSEAHHLGVTRALGNFQLTRLKHRGENGTGWHGPLTAEPEVHKHSITPEDEFIILGSDGLWDVMSSKVAVDLARLQLRIHNDPNRAAEKLIERALSWHTKDNITVIIVCLYASLPAVEGSQSRPVSRAGNRLR